MTALQILLRLLLDDSGVTQIVGDRVFPVLRPQGTDMPAIAVSSLHEDQDVTLSGHRQAFTNRVSVECFAADVATADGLGEAVKSALEVAHIELLDDDASPPDVVARVDFIVKDGADILDFSEDRRVFRRVIDFRMRWTV